MTGHHADTGDGNIEELSYVECTALLGAHSVGRVAVVTKGVIVVVPVNYRFVDEGGKTWIALRTRLGNVLDEADLHAAFEIDDFDLDARTGWSVLVQGTLHDVDPEAADFRVRFDPGPWVRSPRDRWLIVEPFAITGRRLDGGNEG